MGTPENVFDAIQSRTEDFQIMLHDREPQDVASLLQEKNRFGYSAATWAILRSNHAALRAILDLARQSGIPLHCPDTEGGIATGNLLWTAMECYERFPEGLTTVLEYIEKTPSEDGCISHRYTGMQCALHCAAQLGIMEVFRGLRDDLFLSFKLELKDGLGNTALHIASIEGHVEVVKEILVIDPALAMLEDNDGEIPLLRAIQNPRRNTFALVQALVTAIPGSVEFCNRSGESSYTLAQKAHGKQSEGANIPVNLLENRVGDYIKLQILRRPQLSYVVIRTLLHHGCTELSLDLSGFNDPSLDFELWLQDVDELNLKLDTYLKIVKFPDLCCRRKKPCKPLRYGLQVDSPTTRSSATQVFDFIKKQNVRHVLEIDVPDCTFHPHSNSNIQKCLNGLDVRVLMWRKKDLPLDILHDFAPNLEEVTLYSSGNRDILQSWTSYDGLYLFPELTHVTIVLSREEIDGEDGSRIQAEFEAALKNLIKHDHDYIIQKKYHLEDNRLVCDGPGVMPIVGHMCCCSSPRFSPQNINVRLEEAPRKLKPYIKNPGNEHIKRAPETMLDILEHLLAFVRSFSEDSTREDIRYVVQNPIKIVIIDSGVSSELFPNVVGKSFVEDSAVGHAQSLWYIVQNAHGTKMASLVTKMSPQCQIFAARTHNGEGERGVDIKAAIEALKWAISDEVGADIISMSWSLSGSDQNDPLYDAFEQEFNAVKSIIFAATGDNSEQTPASYPARWHNAISICSTNIGGSPSARAETGHSNYWVAGEDVEVDVPRYLYSGGTATVNGSSGATALAAGLASLILSCVRFAFHEEPTSANGHSDDKAERLAVEEAEREFNSFKSAQTMRTVFDNLCKKQGSKFLQPWIKFDAKSALREILVGLKKP